jgi:HAE1 family hydrophobic/amphiphilic exporter-1
LSIVGMAGMLVLTRDTVNIMSLIGLILLMGLVTKNAILLIDFTKVLRRRGMDRRTALVTAGRTRLRPILMTTLAMIFGMLPLALALGQGAEMRAPMARAVIGGLITSTILTLVVVPVVYSVLDDLTAWLRRRWAGADAREHNGEASAEDATAPGVPAPAPTSARSTVTLVLLAALLVPLGAAWAQPAAPEPLTLERAIAIAQEKNRDVEKARAYQQWVRGKYLEERSAAFPQLTLQGGAVRNWDGSFQVLFGDLYPAGQNLYTGDLALSQTVFTWGKVGAAVRAAKSGIESAEDQLELFRQAAIRDVTAAFLDVLLAKELETIAADTLAQRERHQAEAKHRFKLGTATDYDVLAADVAVENVRPEVIHAANAVRTARERLRLVLAEPDLTAEPTGTLEVELADPPGYEEVTAEALERRPDLKELAHRLDVYDELIKIAKAGNKPRLDLRGAAGLKELSAGPLVGRGKTWNVGLYLSFPLFDGFATQGRVLEARSDYERNRIDLEHSRDNVALEAKTTVDAVREAAEIVRSLGGTETQARRLLQMAERGFELGVKTRIEVDDAQLNLRAAQVNLARARRDYRVARVNLDWVRGKL